MKIRIMFAMLLLLSPVLLVLPLPASVVRGQEFCYPADSWTVTTTGVMVYGSYVMIPGVEYLLTVTGYTSSDSNRYDMFYASFDGWATHVVSTIWGDGRIKGNRGVSSYPAYSSDHAYTFELFGTGTVGGVLIPNGIGVANFTVELCALPPADGVFPAACTTVDQFFLIDSSSAPVVSDPLVDSHNYYVWVTGQYHNGPADTSNYGTVGDARFQSTNDFVSQTLNTTIGITGVASYAWADGGVFNPAHLYLASVIGNGGGLSIYSATAPVGGFFVTICDPAITPTPVPTGSPTPTLTPTLTLTPYSHMFPTLDVRPVCTGTPKPSRTPFLLQPTFTHIASWTPEPTRTRTLTPTPEFMFGESIDEPDDPLPTSTYWPTGLPTATNTPRVDGDCAQYFDGVGGGGVPIADFGADDYVREECEAEDPHDCPILISCFGIMPAIAFTIGSPVDAGINLILGEDFINDSNRNINYTGAEICVKRMILKIVIAGLDLTSPLTGILTLMAVLWVISFVRQEI